ERFRVDRCLAEPAGPLEHRLQRTSAEAARAWRLHEIEHGRHQIDVLDEIGHPPSGAEIALLLDDQRDVNRFLVDEQAMLLLAVIAEPLAMIREQDDRRPVVELMRL